jgi:hypothetical protein
VNLRRGGDLDGAGDGEQDEVGVKGYPEAVQDAKLCNQTLEISYKGDEKKILDFLTLID